MSTVFYRKWRPTRFSDVVGQAHITETLRRAVLTERVAHAYLFTGPRGVGKTSTARILAKALNSELDDQGDPLSDTPTSIAIDEGRYMDLIEIDAASNRGIDDIRALRDRVLLRPSQGKYKVYIIDEVHMLTDAAFNALLKTLEEPPPQVVMILATTDIHRVPATIISRCQRFDFRRITAQDVIGRLEEICEAESINCQPEVLELVARSAWGSLRDAENLLEQLAISYGSGDAEVTIEQARSLLGVGDAASANRLATAILTQDAKETLQVIEAEASRGAELKGLRDGTISVLRAALLAKHGVQNLYGEIGDENTIDEKALGASVQQIMHAITTLGRNDRYGDASSPLSLEIASLQALQAVAPPETPVVQQSVAASSTAGAASPQSQANRPAGSTAQQTTRPATPVAAPSSDQGDVKWRQFLDAVRTATDNKVRAVFASVVPVGPDDGVLVLRPKHASTGERLRNLWRDASTRNRLKPAFQKIYGEDIDVKLGGVVGAAGATPSASPQGQAAKSSSQSSPKTPEAPAPASVAQPSASSTESESAESEPVGETAVMDLPDDLKDDATIQMFRDHGAKLMSVQYGMNGAE